MTTVSCDGSAVVKNVLSVARLLMGLRPVGRVKCPGNTCTVHASLCSSSVSWVIAN